MSPTSSRITPRGRRSLAEISATDSTSRHSRAIERSSKLRSRAVAPIEVVVTSASTSISSWPSRVRPPVIAYGRTTRFFLPPRFLLIAGRRPQVETPARRYRGSSSFSLPMLVLVTRAALGVAFGGLGVRLPAGGRATPPLQAGAVVREQAADLLRRACPPAPWVWLRIVQPSRPDCASCLGLIGRPGRPGLPLPLGHYARGQIGARHPAGQARGGLRRVAARPVAAGPGRAPPAAARWSSRCGTAPGPAPAAVRPSQAVGPMRGTLAGGSPAAGRAAR